MYKRQVLDADITGPSIPQMFGVHEGARGGENFILPVVSRGGMQMRSMNVLLPKETDPVVWRGPVIAGAVEQFWTDVIWDNVDYMFVDMPPGTGDVPLTVFQSLPVNGIVVVASPQELVGMIVEKAVNMASMMDKRVLGLADTEAGGDLVYMALTKDAVLSSAVGTDEVAHVLHQAQHALIHHGGHRCV